MKCVCLGAMTTLLLVGCQSPSTSSPPAITLPSSYSESMYQAALDSDSTAPDHILIAILEGRAKTPSLRCIEAPFLKGAIHTEFGIPYDEAGSKKILDLARGCYGRALPLSKHEAIENVSVDHTDADLAAARAAVAKLSRRQLYSREAINRLIGLYPDSTIHLPRQAVAHALLEKGVMTTRGCIGADLTPHRLGEP